LHILKLSTSGSGWPASCPGNITPRERASRTHWIRGWEILVTVHNRGIGDNTKILL